MSHVFLLGKGYAHDTSVDNGIEVSAPTSGPTVALLISQGSIDAAVARTREKKLAMEIGARALAAILIGEDAPLTLADRVGGGLEDDDNAHRARKRKKYADTLARDL